MERTVTIDKAINAIKTAADEIPAEDFISYSTILDVHLSYAHEFFSEEDQNSLLETLADILNTHEDLARDISWDLVSVLLPFLESSAATTLQTAESLIASTATKGNPKEVFIKVLESLSSLSWAPNVSHKDDEDEDEDKAVHSGDEDEEKVASEEEEEEEEDKELHKHSLKKFHALLSALSIVHPRIRAKCPSRFLSTELTTLLGVVMKSVQWLEREEVDGVLRAILEFVELAKPELPRGPQSRKPSVAQGERPPLPPRTSTVDATTTAEVAPAKDDKELLLQARLLVSFLTHILEIYLLRTRTRYNKTSVEYVEKAHSHGSHTHPTEDEDEDESRGLILGWAGDYDEKVTRLGKSKVPGGQTLIDDEREARAGRRDVKQIVEEISALCDGLGLKIEELLKIVETIDEPSENHDEEHEHNDVSAPSTADEVPLSKIGSLFLLAEKLSSQSFYEFTAGIFPEHQKISRNYLILGPGQSQPPVLDAVLYLGALILHEGVGLNEIPLQIEEFLIYLQTFAAISATATSPQIRFLANVHVATCLKKHPDEAVRLAYIKDTLEHCPFESLKERVVVFLKDEIIAATSPSPTSSAPSTPSSIFGSSLALQELSSALFPDVAELLSGSDQQNWSALKNAYPTFVATANLYYFLLKSPATHGRVGVCDKKHVDRVEEKFLAPLRKAVDGFKGVEEAGMGFEMEILKEVLERIGEVKKSVLN
ncbi:uncharacterized protein H6S33_008608 [Morchella sextelata]|uniref:uncharacterized protein n=1 Tax=Morchella sextelata TaxID=1174677 RepID=UPI001D039DA2|nr:uncharacterized protein H6S33_008608 [Morchella sextelata]KAH0602527.1 hypothetical protein H6S33_008608 [Morchella sextelata]